MAVAPNPHAASRPRPTFFDPPFLLFSGANLEPLRAISLL